jgi:glycerol-3-phosphate O-acyltransferase/dihydroxyacetone phosphate acyltransferase
MASRASIGYRGCRLLARALLRAFYGRIDIEGLHRVPGEGGLIVAANHHNSLVDAMLLLAFLPRRLHVLANAPLFRHPIVGPLLRAAGALPVHRREEAGEDPERNAQLFSATTAILGAGGAVLIFPEGRTRPEPRLLDLRTGAARILLAAAGHTARVTLLPVGLVFEEAGTFRRGRALIHVGEPVATMGLPSASGSPSTAARALTSRLATALRGLIVEADDRRALDFASRVDALLRGERAPEPAPSKLRRLRAIVAAHRELARRDAAGTKALALRLERATANPATARSSPGVARRALSSLGTVAGLPLALSGALLHGAPYLLTRRIVGWIPHTEEEDATDKIVAGLFVYPLCWVLETWAALRQGGALCAGILIVVLACSVRPSLAACARVRGLAAALRGRLHPARALDGAGMARDLEGFARVTEER